MFVFLGHKGQNNSKKLFFQEKKKLNTLIIRKYESDQLKQVNT